MNLGKCEKFITQFTLGEELKTNIGLLFKGIEKEPELVFIAGCKNMLDEMGINNLMIMLIAGIALAKASESASFDEFADASQFKTKKAEVEKYD